MKVEMRVSSYHLVDNLAAGLYDNVGQQAMEIIRNGVVASMPDPKKWEPKRAKIEVTLVPNHPLANKGTALSFLDHGSGITESGFQRYFAWLGTPHEYVNSSATGASRKGIGRVAAFSLNQNCITDDYEIQRVNGYYIFTRTSKSGKIRFIPVKPMMSDDGGFEIDRWIEPNDSNLGHLNGINGSFTAIVIPTPVFKSHSEIYEAIKYLLPREQDKMFDLHIGGKSVQPPPLESDINMTSEDGRFRARLGVGDANSNGAWLCDAETGFRVASCQALGRMLPEPLWFPDIVGDIFAPGVLRYQNTARSTLAKEFTRKVGGKWQNKDCRDLMMFLVQVAPPAKSLIERDAITGNAADVLDEVTEMFNDCFGPPEDDITEGPILPGQPKPKPDGPRPPRPNPGDDDPNKDKPVREKYRRYISIKVREETFFLYRGKSLHPYIFAQVNPSNEKMIEVNVRGGYKALPKNKPAMREHCLMEILDEIGSSKFPDRPSEAKIFARQVRSEFPK
jgi:hypothetical protein